MSTQDDKFRIHIAEVGTLEVLGRKDIPVQLLPHSTDNKLVFAFQLFTQKTMFEFTISDTMKPGFRGGKSTKFVTKDAKKHQKLPQSDM